MCSSVLLCDTLAPLDCRDAAELADLCVGHAATRYHEYATHQRSVVQRPCHARPLDVLAPCRVATKNGLERQALRHYKTIMGKTADDNKEQLSVMGQGVTMLLGHQAA